MFGPVSHVFFSTLWNRQNEDFSARAQFCPQRSDFTSWHHFWNLQTKLPHPRTVLGLFPQWKVRLKFINRPKIGHARENPDSGSKLASLKSAPKTSGAPPDGFSHRKKCSTQRIYCWFDVRNDLGGLQNTFVLPTFETEGQCMDYEILVENT